MNYRNVQKSDIISAMIILPSRKEGATAWTINQHVQAYKG